MPSEHLPPGSKRINRSHFAEKYDAPPIRFRTVLNEKELPTGAECRVLKKNASHEDLPYEEAAKANDVDTAGYDPYRKQVPPLAGFPT